MLSLSIFSRSICKQAEVKTLENRINKLEEPIRQKIRLESGGKVCMVHSLYRARDSRYVFMNDEVNNDWMKSFTVRKNKHSNTFVFVI